MTWKLKTILQGATEPDRYYLDDKRRRGFPFLIHRNNCLFRRDGAWELGQFSFPSGALEAATAHRKNVGQCELCCPIGLFRKKRKTKVDRLAERLAR